MIQVQGPLTAQLPPEITEYILELAVLSIDLYPHGIDEIDWCTDPTDHMRPLERRYARTRDLNELQREKIASAFARVCRSWASMARRLLYTSVKDVIGVSLRVAPRLISCLARSPLNAAIITSLVCDNVEESLLPLLLPLLPSLIQLDLCIHGTHRQRHTFHLARFDHLQRLAIKYSGGYMEPSRYGTMSGSLRSILNVLREVSTLEHLSLEFFSSDPNLDDQDDGLDEACPIPSHSLKYLRLSQIRSLDYDLSPLLSTSTSTLHDLVLDDFDSAYTLSPSNGPFPVVHAIATCCTRLQRLTLRSLYDHAGTVVPFLLENNEFPSLQYLYWEPWCTYPGEIGRHLESLSAPVLRHLTLRHHVFYIPYTEDVELIHAPWISFALEYRQWPMLETWSFDTTRTRQIQGGPWRSIEDPPSPFGKIVDALASEAGVELVVLPRLAPTSWRMEIGNDGQEFCEPMQMLDLEELLSLQRSHLVSHSHLRRASY